MNKKIVVLGGGTGLSVLLRGLKQYPLDITAVVAVSDDGSSTGRLRSEFKIPAIGDIRNVMVALSEAEPTVQELLQYRFITTSDLNNHAVGNLMITAMLNIKGNLKDAISSLSEVIKMKGRVLPLTEDLATLVARFSDGTIKEGESNITGEGKKIEKLYYKDKIEVVPEVLDAIIEADLVLFGIGSLYTSVIPHLLCPKVREAIKNSSAKKMYACNIMTEHGETDNFKVSDYINTINKYIGSDFLDVVLVNKEKASSDVLNRYSKVSNSKQVELDRENIEIEVLEKNLLTIEKNYIRHKPLETGFAIFSYMMNQEE